MLKISDAVILMAGAGSRLRESANLPKPLVPVAGRPLVSYAIDALEAVGVTRLHVVLGANAATLLPAIERLVPNSMELNAIHNSQWEKQNGVSVLTAENEVAAPFFLLMGDHLFEPGILDLLLARSEAGRLNLAIDRKIGSIFDLDDAMKVELAGDRIIAISKSLSSFDAIDTGIFLCPKLLFAALRRIFAERNDCSLADGVRLMGADGNALGVDIGEAWWQDVDTPEMLARAEQEAARLTSAATAEAARSEN